MFALLLLRVIYILLQAVDIRRCVEFADHSDTHNAQWAKAEEVQCGTYSFWCLLINEEKNNGNQIIWTNSSITQMLAVINE
jgi:hypothetical protein